MLHFRILVERRKQNNIFNTTNMINTQQCIKYSGQWAGVEIIIFIQSYVLLLLCDFNFEKKKIGMIIINFKWTKVANIFFNQF